MVQRRSRFGSDRMNLKRAIALRFLNNWLKGEIKTMPKHPKTTILGILTIAGAIIHAATALLNGMDVDWTMTIAAITGGWGLIHAADAKKE